jgi:hypothetical protein
VNNIYKKFVGLVCLFVFSNLFSLLKSEKRYAEDVFEKFIDVQYILPDVCLTDMNNYITEYNFKDLYLRFTNNVSYIRTLIQFYNIPTNDVLEKIFIQPLILENELRNRCATLLEMMESDFSAFVKHLIDVGFSEAVVDFEEHMLSKNIAAENYVLLMQTLLFQQDFFKMAKFFLSAGNRFFEYCFYENTFADYKNLLLHKNLHSIGKFLHAVIWKYLVSIGWKWWHKDCLDSIKKQCDDGAQLIYIAGGCDIYSLIKHGIYNIKIVDPFLPSQAHFYVNGWKWLIVGDGKRYGIGDEIEFIFDDKRIIMERINYKVMGRSFPKLSTGHIVECLESETVWKVYNEHKIELGQVIFDKRFCSQSDFVFGPDKVVVMSTTEMISSIDVEENNGWGIDVQKLDSHFEMHVKQLRKPINTNVLKHVRFACENQKRLRFIMLASNPT